MSNLIEAQSDKVVIYNTTKDDIKFVLKLEQDPMNSPYVVQWSYDEHANALLSKNCRHFIIKSRDTGLNIGYVILDDVTNKAGSINLRRIVISDKGNGVGRITLKLIKEFVFSKLLAHRLWLDVCIDNKLAYKLYESEGFINEGIMRDSHKRKDSYISQHIMSILADEYYGKI